MDGRTRSDVDFDTVEFVAAVDAVLLSVLRGGGIGGGVLERRVVDGGDVADELVWPTAGAVSEEGP